jgi:hypothetical protein
MSDAERVAWLENGMKNAVALISRLEGENAELRGALAAFVALDDGESDQGDWYRAKDRADKLLGRTG